MFTYLVDDSLLRLQPLVAIDDQLLGKTRAESGPAVLVTAAGRRHPSAPVASRSLLWQRGLRGNLDAAELLLLGELPRRVAALRTDPVAYYVDYLVPTFEQRDYSDDPYAEQPIPAEPKAVDWTTELRARRAGLPAPEFVAPAMFFFGRVWRLRADAPRVGRMQVFCGDQCFCPSGEFFVVSTLHREWQGAVTKWLSRTAGELAVKMRSDDDSSAVVQARRELTSRGVLECGDLLLLPGTPARLGYVVPRHYNRTFRRESNRDLAMTLPLTLPQLPSPSTSIATVYERAGAGWRPVTLPHGFCLGPAPPSYPQESPGIGLASFLRWAAQPHCGKRGFPCQR